MTAPALQGLDELAAARTERTALVFDGAAGGEPWTWAGFAGRVGGAAEALLARGAAAGATLAVAGPNGPEWVVLREAAAWLRLTFVPVGPKLAPAERDFLLANSEADLILGDPALAAGEVPVADWTAVAHARPAALPPRPTGGESVQLLYTSGSGGVPKGVLRPRSRDAARIAQTIAVYGLRADDRHLVAGPLYHSGPVLFYNVYRALGAEQVVMPRFDAARVVEWITGGGADALFLVPTMWRMVLEALDAQRLRPRLRVAWTAGSPMDRATRERLLDWLGEGVLWEFYGATETGTVAVLPPDRQRSHAHTCGFPAPGVEVEVRAPDGTPQPAGEPGRVYVRSATTMLGYHHGPGSPADLAPDADGDWLSVGDRGYRTEDGALVLLGREGGMVISGGVNVYPEEVEAALKSLPGVREAVVFGLDDPRWGQALAALVEPAVAAAPTRAELDAGLRRRIAGFKVPKRWRIGPIPRTQTGKVVRDPAALGALLSEEA